MADMKIAMTLTMADLASPEIQKFKANIAQLEDYLKGLGDSFKVAIGGAADLGKATADAAGGVTALSRASSGASRSTGRLADTLKVMQDALAGMGAKLAEVADNMAAMSASTADMASASKGAAAGIAAMGDAAGVADTKMAGMHGTMKGLLELYGALKIGEGLKKSVEEASTYQQTMMMLKMRNLPASQVSALAAGARSLSNAIPLLNRNQGLEAELAAQPGLPGQSAFSKGMRAQLLPGVTRLGLVAGTFGDTASMTHRVQNIFGIIEALGGAENVSRAQMILKDVRGAIVASHGKLDVRSIETALRTTNPGIRTNMNSPEFQRELALQEEMKAAGGGGSGGNTRIATLMNNIFMAANKGLMAKGAAVVMETLGLLNPADVHKYGKSSYYAALNPGALAGSAMASQSPSGWVQQYLLPALTKFGEMHWKRFGYTSDSAAAFSNPTQIGRANAEAASYLASFRMGGQQFAGGLGLLGNPNVMAAVNSQIHAQTRATGISSKADLQLRLNTAAGAAQKLDAQLANLGIQIGTALLPALTNLANGISFITRVISNLNSHFPIFSKIEAWVGALAALLLGIKGVEWLLGIKDAFTAIKGVELGGTLVKWAASAVLGEDAVAGLTAGMGTMGAVIAGLAGPLTLAVVAIGGLGYAAYRLYTDLTNSHSIGIKSGYSKWGNNHPIGMGIKSGTTWTSSADSGPAELAGLAAYHGARNVSVMPGSIISRMGATPSAGAIAKHTAAIANAHQKAIDHIFAIADQAAAKATQIAAKMNAAAVKLHLAFMAMTNPLGAKIAGVNLKYGGIAKEMTGAGHPGAAADALAIGHHQVLQYQYQGAMQHLAALKGNLHQNLTNTAALVTAGSLTKMQAAQQTIQMQKQAAPAMIQAADAALKYAKALGDPKLVQALQMQRAHLQAMGKQLGYYSASVKNTMQGAFTGLFQNIMHGQKTWGQMFYSFFASIGKGIENILAKSISQSITTSLFGKKANQGIGSIIGGIAHMAGNLFGGSGGSGSSAFSGAGIMGTSAFSGGSSIMSSVGGWIKGITSIASLFGFASGANNIPNDMVANIHKGEMIIPAAGASLIRSGQAAIGGMPGGNQLHLTIHAMDSQSVISALHSVRNEATQLFMNTASHMNLQGG